MVLDNPGEIYRLTQSPEYSKKKLAMELRENEEDWTEERE